ncbi:peptidoglycan glycosyltransferase FtsI [Histophilus somni]|uniref:peptidoglycan glycosyltransferase FtsI n=1 Tax=Histophilus somni TaxID=731 RepID=UPI00094AF439|nr:peptidoglycan glycosyltransferase FtsI [Histophilus somni]ARU65417.1 peptidoglycan synthase [Histophilus somni]ARU73601.1 peptidoglycan synthase [Histophilus somni]MBB5151235.1 cell division protein FtsI (penicillin-binding protein 3) [Histophilus somni]QEH10117.1 peptidoglycan glycosyltransferase FtsI [Histophilus somni]QEH13788.1 peptidoglycan glycosyltransferase FtsI [Histophilus somni]
MTHNKINRKNKRAFENGAKRNQPKKIYENSFLKWRFMVVVGLIILSLTALVGRATYVQMIKSDVLSNEADERSLRKEKILSMRGTIVDRNGQLLSVSVPMFSISAEPKKIFSKNGLQDEERWRALAKALGMSYKDLRKILEKNPKSSFVYLARQVSPTIAEYVKELNLYGVNLKTEPRRFYPKTEETAHLLGYTNIDGEGIEGIEKSFNSFLVGKPGSRTVRKDRHGRIIENISDLKKYDPQNVILSIDEKLQSVAYREIKKAVEKYKAESGTAVLVDIHTGEVLAMANAPSYNPNIRTSFKTEVMRNRAITDTFEPGSTIKPFVILTALEKKVVRRDEIIDTGRLVLDGYEVKDVAVRDRQTLDQILENSSNRGVSRLALRMPANALIDTYKKAGLGQRTELGLVGEQAGFLNADRKKWSDIDRASVSFGYGISTTPLQLARAYVTLGSFGIYRPLSITKVDPPVIGQRVFSEKMTREVVNMMEKVAIKNKRAMVEGYRVGIKTGTAKKIENGKYVNKYIAYTAGLAPISNPRYALVVLINDPKGREYYGGVVSAPVFSNIMSYALKANNIPPDSSNYTKTVRRTVYLNSQENKANAN